MHTIFIKHHAQPTGVTQTKDNDTRGNLSSRVVIVVDDAFFSLAKPFFSLLYTTFRFQTTDEATCFRMLTVAPRYVFGAHQHQHS